MSFNNTLVQSLSQGATPVVLLQLNIRQLWNAFIVDSAGIWKFSTLTNVYSGIDTDLTDGFPTLTVVGVGDVIVNGVSLPEITSYTNTIDGRATALAAEPSFIFDGVNDVLYCRFNDDYDPPTALEINIGVIFALSDIAYYDYVNNVNYAADLDNTPSFPQKKDPIFFNELSFEGFVQNINNTAYQYDDKKDSNIFGALAEYYIGTTELQFEFFEKIYVGRVAQSSFTRDKWILKIRDSRKALTNKVPISFIDPAVYTDADDYALSTPAPILYGNVVDVPCLSLNENQSPAPSTYTFLFGDASTFDLYVTGAVIKVDGNVVTPASGPSGTTGLFTLNAADYEPGQTVTYTGGGILDSTPSLITNQLDIAKHLLANYADIPYTASNFNTTEWDAETLLASDNIGVAITEVTTVIKVIQQLAATSAAGFLRQPDGLLTWRSVDESADPLETITNNDWLDDPRLDNNAEEVLTSATVRYNRSVDRDLWERVTDDSKETEVSARFNVFRNREFDTLYTSSTDALLFAQDIMSRSDNVRDIITGTVGLQFLSPEIGQNVQIELNHSDGSEWLGFLKCEVLETLPDIRNGRLRLVLRAFEELGEFIDLAPDGGLVTESDVFIVLEDNTTFFVEE